MIIPMNSAFRPKVNQIIAEEWAGPIVVTKGKAHDTSNADGFLAVEDGELAGYILYAVRDGECEILVLHSLLENRGVGSALINAIAESRKLKPSIPQFGNDGIPILHEFEFSYPL